MITTPSAIAFDRGIDPILRFLTPAQIQALVEYRGDDALRLRIDDLATMNNEGRLTEQERAEYQGYVRANMFVAIFQARARRMLRESATS